MWLFLLAISSVFAAVFYFFSTAGVEGEFFLPLYSGFFYVWIGVLFFLRFFFSISKKKNSEQEEQKEKSLNIGQYIQEDFLKKNIYFVWFFLFYCSLFIIFRSLWYDFSVCIFLFNIGIFLLFFLSKKFFVFRDFIKTNTLIFSLYYACIFIIGMFSDLISLGIMDVFNSFFLLIFFLLTFYFDARVLEKKSFDNALIVGLSFYVFVLLLYWFSVVFWDMLFMGIIVSFLSFLLFFYGLTNLSFLQKNSIALKQVSLIFLYISMFLMVAGTFVQGENIILYFLLLLCWGINIALHFRYENYISFFLWSSALFFVFNTFTITMLGASKIFLALFFSIAFMLVLVTYFFKNIHISDVYFLHIFSYLIHIITIIQYLSQNIFEFLHFWIILLLVSIFSFLSYYRLQKI